MTKTNYHGSQGKDDSNLQIKAHWITIKFFIIISISQKRAKSNIQTIETKKLSAKIIYPENVFFIYKRSNKTLITCTKAEENFFKAGMTENTKGRCSI